MLRLLRLARPLRGRLLLAVAAGAAATGCGIALLAVSGFMLARASEHPNIIAIAAAVVAVRALSVGRGTFRYGERLASHDVAFRVLADVRVSIYRRLERLAPAGLRAFRSGDLLARLVSDVDATQDLFIRAIAPPLTALLAGGGAVILCLLLLGPAAGVLAAGLVTAGVAVPLLAARRARAAGRRTAPVRGELSAGLTGLVAGAADLHAFGAQDTALAAVAAHDRSLTRLARRSASAEGLGAGLMAGAAGLTLWGVLLLGVACGRGGLTRVTLAVLALTALAAFDAVTALPSAAVQMGQARASAVRVGAVLDTPNPVTDPAAPRPLPGGPLRVTLRNARVRYEPGGSLALDAGRPGPGGREAGRAGRPERGGEVHRGRGSAQVLRSDQRHRHLGRTRPARLRRRRRTHGDRRLHPGPPYLQRQHPGEHPAGAPGRLRRRTGRSRPAGAAAALDRIAPARLGYPGRDARRRGLRRGTPAARASPGPARRA